jgi:hypothetical protein
MRVKYIQKVMNIQDNKYEKRKKRNQEKLDDPSFTIIENKL